MIHKLTLPIPFEIGTVNVYVVEGKKLTLIDAGVKTKECWEEFNKGLNKIGYDVNEIEQVVLTHHHVDHVGLLDYFPAAVKVNGHSSMQPWLTQEESFVAHYNQEIEKVSTNFGIPHELRKRGINLTRTLRFSCKRELTSEVAEGDAVEGLTGFKVIEVPGHASTHIALYNEKEELLIGGDVLLNRISSNPIIEPPLKGQQERIKPLLQYNDSLRRLASMNIQRILPGHGDEVRQVKELVGERLEKQHHRALKVLALLKGKELTAFELSKLLFPTLYEKQLILTISETVGQLDYLEYNDLVEVNRQDEAFRYYVK